MEPTEQLAAIVPALTVIVDGIEDDQLGNATPCSDFTVQGVLDHMMGLSSGIVATFRGDEPSSPAPVPAAGAVPREAFRIAMHTLLDAANSPGAMERTVSAPVGDVPGSTFARFVAFDGLIHGYDLAHGTGQSYDPPQQVVVDVDRFAREAIGPEMRDGDTFADATTPPPGASDLERLVAFSGRTL